MLPAESTAIPNGRAPVVPKMDDAACAEPANVAAQSSDAQTPASTVAQRRKEEPTAKLIIPDPRFPISAGLLKVSEATVVARQQMTWKYLWRENYRMSPQNAPVALPSARHHGTQAEGEGFEPSVQGLPVQQFSRLPRSTAPAPLRGRAASARQSQPSEPPSPRGRGPRSCQKKSRKAPADLAR